ncbi:MAG: hypothetical protein ACQKBV_11275 [Puniceicoccales bacterium]
MGDHKNIDNSSIRHTRRVTALSILLVSLAAFLTGCATDHPLNYTPSSIMSATGSVSVGDFAYLPAEKGEVDANQIRNTAIGSVKFEDPISDYYRQAVLTELRFVGININSNNHVLSGEVMEFLADDLGYSIDWTITVRYIVKSPQGAVLYDQTKTVERNTNKFSNVFTAMNESVKMNIEDLIKDPEFIQAIN